MSEAELDRLVKEYEAELNEGIREIKRMVRAMVYGSFIIILVNVIYLFIIGFGVGFTWEKTN